MKTENERQDNRLTVNEETRHSLNLFRPDSFNVQSAVVSADNGLLL